MFVLMLLLGTLPAYAQRFTGMQELPPTNQKNFAPIELPDANIYRSASGAPGHAYWQQRADYQIQVTLDPSRHLITGSEVITYTNNSPDTLKFLWLQLDQNLFRPDSRGRAVNPPNARWRGAFEEGGFRITRVRIQQGDRTYTPEQFIEDTMMRLDLHAPLSPGGDQVKVYVDYAFVVPEYGADRMGRLKVEQGWIYEIAQWYPRMYVYDDVNGWNVLPYLGQGEFYLDYGTYDVEITVPRSYFVVATGTLLNEEDVYTSTQRERLARARKSAETVYIVRPEEVGKPGIRPEGSDMLTWKFHAEQVRDFAWAASDAFILDAAGWEDVLLMSAYPKEGLGPDKNGNPGWEMSTQFIRHSISFYSRMFYRYPYPVAINVAGIVGGMEYPMIVFCSVRARGQALFGVTDHEFGHQWFPMIVGNDERRYAWMDEGFNTFMNHYSNIAYYGSKATRSRRTSSAYIAERMQQAIADQPIMTYPDQIRPMGLGFLGYRKPGYGLILLREIILGPERFDRAFQTYIRRWAFKHPMPADFFRTMENVAGEDLDWFWREWFYKTWTLDQAVDAVTIDTSGTRIVLSNRDKMVMPVEVEIAFANGKLMRQKLPVEIWMRGDTYTLLLDTTTPITYVLVDPDNRLPDVNRKNNIWPAGHRIEKKP